MKDDLQSMLLSLKKCWLPPLPETGNKRSMFNLDNLVLAIFLFLMMIVPMEKCLFRLTTPHIILDKFIMLCVVR